MGQARIELSAPLRLSTLTRAATALQRQYPQLAAGFLVDADVEPTQFVAPVAPRIRVTTLGSLSANETQAQVAKIAAAEAEEKFDLADPPLLRWHLVEAAHHSVLILTAHHAVLDAWSMPLVLNELARLGSAEPGTAPKTCDYSAHLTQLQGADHSGASAFWKRELEHLKELPCPRWLDFTNTTDDEPTTTRRRCEHNFSPEYTARLANRVRELGTTPAAVLRGCVSLAVDWLSGTIGTPIVIPVHGRDSGLDGVENTPGLFADSVLTAPQTTPGPLADVLRSLENAWNASLQYHHVGISGILRALGIADPARILYAHETVDEPTRARLRDTDNCDITLTLVGIEDSTHYPVEVTTVLSRVSAENSFDDTYRSKSAKTYRTENADAAATTLSICIEVDSQLAVGSEMRLLTAIIRLLDALVSDPHQEISSIDLRTNEDQRIHENVLSNYSTKHKETRSKLFAAPGSVPLLPDAFDTACAAHSTKTALISNDKKLTFSQLASQVETTRAQLLIAMSAHSGKNRPSCALQMPRSIEAIVMLLASLTAGFTTVVLDPQTPPKRRDQVLDDLSIDLLIDSGGAQRRKPEGLNATPQSSSCTPVRWSVNGTDIAFIVLTSGSTGQPKPVAVPHSAMATLLDHHRQHLWDQNVEVIAHTNALHFDAHWDALLGLFDGRTVRLVDTETILDPHALAALLNHERIDYLDLGPAVWASHLAAGLLTSLPAICVAGGEAFPPHLWTKMQQLAGNRSEHRILNAYGPTENTVDAFIADVNASAEPRVGQAIGGTTAAVLDTWLRPVAVGCEGELYLGGTQLTHGYFGKAGLTAERFIAGPSGTRLYRTGDYAWIDPSGSLALLGRADDQLSINGFRIEPGEITAALTGLPNVLHAHAAAVDHPSGGRRLVAWVQAEPHALSLDLEVVRRSLYDLLPPHLVPSAVLKVNFFPITTNGKIDVRALPLPTWSHTDDAASIDDKPVLSAASASVCEGTAHVIGRASADLSLRSQGGDSISAIRISAWLRRNGWALEAGSLLSANSLNEAAARAVPVTNSEQISPTEAAPAVISLPTELRNTLPADVQISEKLPLSGTLAGMYVMSMRAGTEDPYRTATLLRVEAASADQLSQPKLEAAWDAVLAAHPALRSVIAQGNDSVPSAYLIEPGSMTHYIIDATNASNDPTVIEALRSRALKRAIAEQSLADGRLICAVWLRLPQESASEVAVVELALGVHHLLADGWTTPLLADSFAKALHGELLPMDTSWGQYLRWCAAQDTAEWEAEWQQLFNKEPIRTIIMPSTEPDGSEPSDTSVQRKASNTLQAIKQARAVWQPGERQIKAMMLAAQTMDVTPASAIQAAWARTLAETTGSKKVVFEMASAGRDVPIDGIEQAVGAFLTTRPVLADTNCSAEQLCIDLMNQTARTERAAHLGAGAIAQLINADCDSLLVIEAAHASITKPIPECELRHHLPRVVPVRGTDSSGYPVTLTKFESSDGPMFELELSGLDATATAAEVLLRRFARQLTELLDVPDALIQSRIAPAQDEITECVEPAEYIQKQHDITPPVPNERIKHVHSAMTQALSVDVHNFTASDDFFSSGGDSILVMSVVSSLRREGYSVKISDVFEARTPEALASRISLDADAASSIANKPVLTEGSLPLTPALRWYTAHVGDSSDHFLQLRTLSIPCDLTDVKLRDAVLALVSRHEALRTQLRGHQVHTASSNTLDDHILFKSAINSPHGELTELRAAAARIDPTTGHLLTAVRTRADRLILIAHHLGVDAISWPILISDLRALVHDIALPAAESFRAAAAALHTAAGLLRTQSQGVRALFERMRTADGAPASDSAEHRQLTTVGEAQQRIVRLSQPITKAILQRAAAGIPVDVQLAAAFAFTAQTGLLVEFEGHGRPLKTVGDARDNIDFASVVGWFTQTWPVPLPSATGLSITDHLQSCASRCSTLTAFADSLALTGAADDIHCELLVNYLGREGSTETTDYYDGPAEWSVTDNAADYEDLLGSGLSLRASHPWELNAALDGEQLLLRWQCADPALDSSDVDKRIDAVVTALTDYTLPANSKCNGAPTDFGIPVLDLVGANPAELAQLHQRGLDGLWPLTPAQTGIALESLGDEHGRYWARTDLVLNGSIDTVALERAVNAISAHEPALRMQLTQLGNQHVLASMTHITPDFRVFDSRAEAETWLKEPLDITFDRLSRWAFVRDITGARHRFILLDHHLVLDGWSIPLVVEALFDHYRADADSIDHKSNPSHSTLSSHPLTKHILSRNMPTVSDQTLLRWDAVLPSCTGAVFPETNSEHATISAPIPACTSSVAQRFRISPAEAITTAWTAALSAAARVEHFITGTVVSGRGLTDTNTIGMLLKTVPVGARFAGQDVRATLTSITDATRLAQSNIEAPLSELARRRSAPQLFDTLIVVENYPTLQSTHLASGINLIAVDSRDDTHYPLALTVEFNGSTSTQSVVTKAAPDQPGLLHLDYATSLFNEHDAEALLAGVSTAMHFLQNASPDTPSDKLLEAVRAVLSPATKSLSFRTPKAPLTADSSLKNPDSTSQSDAFKAVVSALNDALGCEPKPEDDFFALGGDSLTAMTVITALRARGWKLTATQMFANPTPRAMALLAVPCESRISSREPAPEIADSTLDAAGQDALAALLEKIQKP